jgi:DNA-directed RNA polymerase I and III subunit RPAC1
VVSSWYNCIKTAPASYRLLPVIEIIDPIVGENAVKFQKCFPKGTIKIVKKNGKDIAVVDNPRKDTASRECFRHAEFKDKVKLGRVRDHFICKFILI